MLRSPRPGAEPEKAGSRALRAVVDAVHGAGGPTRLRAGIRGTAIARLKLPWKPSSTAFTRVWCSTSNDASAVRTAYPPSLPSAVTRVFRTFLSLAGIPTNEIAHSGVIRSLLDPGTSPAIAPLLLMGLVEALVETKDASSMAPERPERPPA